MTDEYTCEECGEHICPECGAHADHCKIYLQHCAEFDRREEMRRRSDPVQRRLDEAKYLATLLLQRAARDASALPCRFMTWGGVHDRPRLNVVRWSPSLMNGDRDMLSVLADDELLEYHHPDAHRSLTHTFVGPPRPRDLQAAYSDMVEKLTRAGYTLTIDEAQQWCADRRPPP